jgi:cytosine deaminase
MSIEVPAFVDAHVHLDKAFHLEVIDAPIRDVHDAIRVTAALQRAGSAGDPRAAADRLLGEMVRHGTTAARVHVEVNAMVGTDAVRWHRVLAEKWADDIDLQLVAFPQLGWDGELMEEAMRLGCDVVGGCPYADDDQAAHVRQVFDLAERLDRPVDLHVDFTDDPDVHHVDEVIAETVRCGWAGRVAVGHVTSLAAMAPEARAARLRALAAAGVAVVILPATDLFLNGAMAPFNELVAAGVDVAIASNNVQNAFTPFGRADLLQLAWLTAVTQRADPCALLDAITTVPARILGLGERADRVVLDTDVPAEVVAGPARVTGRRRRPRTPPTAAR